MWVTEDGAEKVNVEGGEVREGYRIGGVGIRVVSKAKVKLLDIHAYHYRHYIVINIEI